jgi:hypothetical protein
MPEINIVTHGDHEKVGRDLGTDRLPMIHTTCEWTIDAMEHGMQSGNTSLMLLIPAHVEDTEVLIAAETSLSCFMSAATILAAKFKDEVEMARVRRPRRAGPGRARPPLCGGNPPGDPARHPRGGGQGDRDAFRFAGS